MKCPFRAEDFCNYLLNNNLTKEIKKITKIEKKKEDGFVWDIVVEKNHNFFANNVLVHNPSNPGSQTFFGGYIFGEIPSINPYPSLLGGVGYSCNQKNKCRSWNGQIWEIVDCNNRIATLNCVGSPTIKVDNSTIGIGESNLDLITTTGARFGVRGGAIFKDTIILDNYDEWIPGVYGKDSTNQLEAINYDTNIVYESVDYEGVDCVWGNDNIAKMKFANNIPLSLKIGSFVQESTVSNNWYNVVVINNTHNFSCIRLDHIMKMISKMAL